MQENPVTHVAVIMDGNGRWAQKRGLPRTGGHKVGAEVLRKIIEWATQTEIEHLTCYAFSTENWKRPKIEVTFLMTLFSSYLEKKVENFKKNGSHLKIIEDKTALSKKLQKLIVKAESETANGQNLQLNLAVNYGSQQDITEAVRLIAQEVLEGKMNPAEIQVDTITNHLSTAGIPEPDLLIRPGGDFRISNYLLWELAYTEFFFYEKLWPDFTVEDMEQILSDFKNRERRFGGLVDSGGTNA